jgi:hypothetical protein
LGGKGRETLGGQLGEEVAVYEMRSYRVDEFKRYPQVRIMMKKSNAIA